MKLTKVMAVLGALVGTASADGMSADVKGVGDCPHPKRPPAVHRKPPVKSVTKPLPPPPIVPAPPAPCTCVGQEGPSGPQGPIGPPGNTRVMVVTHEVRDPGIAVRLGVMGQTYAPHGDWEWGPALQLGIPLSRNGRNEFVIDAGIGVPADGASWSPGRESGLMLHAGMAHYFRDARWLGATAGLIYTVIDGSASNGHIDGKYLSGDVGLVVRHSFGRYLDVRAELGPTLGGLRDTHAVGDTQFDIGAEGTAFIGGRW